MSLFATVAIVCTMATCNNYTLDTAKTESDGFKNTQAVQTGFDSIWKDEKPLTEWLKENRIGETVFEIVSIEFETQPTNDEDIP